MNWLTLITSLPTENATLRQRAWRALRSSGAAVLRDGVYLMPDRQECEDIFEQLAQELRDGGGTAMVLATQQPNGQTFTNLFDRSNEYSPLLIEAKQVLRTLDISSLSVSLKSVRRMRRTFDGIAKTDFFPNTAQTQTLAALMELEQACARTHSPDEPSAKNGDISRLNIEDYQGRIWATRARPWADRLASAWLIRRFIDPLAEIRWLKETQSCPKKVLGFDFDGATFTHVGERVTFEVLLESFNLSQSVEGEALQRLALLIHFLDVGGIQPPEAIGVEAVLAGMRECIVDDDSLLLAASKVFDALLLNVKAVDD